MAGFGEVAERLRRSTVQISDSNSREGTGSGILWTSKGLILTNAHVLRSSVAEVQLWDGSRHAAKVQQRDNRRDLVSLQIPASGLPEALVAESPSLRAGELVVAVGNPLGFLGAVSTGIAQAVGPFRGLGPRSWVQSTVRLAPGNSGGPLANARGEIVGVNTMIAGMGGSGSLALAIPSAAAQSFLSQTNQATGPLGITARPIVTQGERTIGFLILELQEGLAAEQASLFPGDLLTGANGRPFRDIEDLSQAIAEGMIIGQIHLQFRRNPGLQTRHVTVSLTKRRVAAA